MSQEDQDEVLESYRARGLAGAMSFGSRPTVVVCGATTSSCIRATVVDALQHGFRPFVVEECVGDRAEEPHRANLRDIRGKYGEVIYLASATEALGSFGRPT